jgi:hypothetical protein
MRFRIEEPMIVVQQEAHDCNRSVGEGFAKVFVNELRLRTVAQ